MTFSTVSRPEKVLRQATLREVAEEAAYRLEGGHFDEPKVLRPEFGTNWQVGQALRRKVLALRKSEREGQGDQNEA